METPEKAKTETKQRTCVAEATWFVASQTTEHCLCTPPMRWVFAAGKMMFSENYDKVVCIKPFPIFHTHTHWAAGKKAWWRWKTGKGCRQAGRTAAEGLNSASTNSVTKLQVHVTITEQAQRRGGSLVMPSESGSSSLKMEYNKNTSWRIKTKQKFNITRLWAIEHAACRCFFPWLL